MGLAVAAPPAGAQSDGSVGITVSQGGGSFALAGAEALLADDRGAVLALPITPGAAATERARFRVPEDGRVEVRLAGDSTGAAAVAVVEDGTSVFRTGRLLAAPLGAPLAPLTTPLDPARSFAPALVQRDDGRIFSSEVHAARRDLDSRIVVREPGRPPAVVAVPALAFSPVVFAGELVAYRTRDRRGGSGDDVLTVAAWRTRRVERRVAIPGGIDHLDLRRDGSVVVGRRDGGVLEVLPDASRPRVVARNGTRPVYAGDNVVFVREGNEVQRLAIARPGRPPRSFGPPSELIDGPVADERVVLHRANDCLLATAVDAPATSAPVDGPCPRGELTMPSEQGNPVLRRDRRLSVLLRCVAAETRGCVGRAELRLADSDRRAAPLVTFRIAAGSERRVVFRLSRSAASAARREARDGFGAGITVRATIVDSAGRSSTLEDGELAMPEGG